MTVDFVRLNNAMRQGFYGFDQIQIKIKDEIETTGNFFKELHFFFGCWFRNFLLPIIQKFELSLTKLPKLNKIT